MTVLTTQIFNLKAAASILGPEPLAKFMADGYHHLCEIAVRYGGRIPPASPTDLMVTWDSMDSRENAECACNAAWELLRRSRELSDSLVRCYGVDIVPRTGIATDPWCAGGDSEQLVARPITRSEVKALSRVVQRANSVFETRILVDDATAQAAAGLMSFCEIDFFGDDGGGMSQLIAKLGQSDTVSNPGSSLEGTVFRVSELLGPSGEVSTERISAAMAFRGAMELYRQGELTKAATVFELLSTGPSRGALARYYLSRCRLRGVTNSQTNNELETETAQSA